MRLDLVSQRDFLSYIRSFFTSRDVLEVHTACLLPTTVPDINIASIGSRCDRYLQTSPEFAMKSLLARGAGDIFQMAHAFRDDTHTPWHRYEFLMLEWYRHNWDDKRLLEEVKELVSGIMPGDFKTVSILQWLLSQSWNMSDMDSWLPLAQSFGLQGDDYHPWDALDFLIQSCVYHSGGIDQWIVYVDFPSIMPTFAACDGDVQKRFELYYGQVEIANGCCEETNIEILRSSLVAMQSHREMRGGHAIGIDDEFLNNCDRLADMSGVAIGLDRLYAVKTSSMSMASLLHL